MIKTIVHHIARTLLFIAFSLRLLKSRVCEWFGVVPKPSIKRWTVDRAFLFCEPNDAPLDDDDASYIDVRRHYDIDFAEDDVLDQLAALVPSSWPSWRCELRYVKGDLKRRIVLRQGETYSISELGTMRSTRCSPKARVVRAWLVGSEGNRIDVTQRVEKYVIHTERSLHPMDLFPFDVEDDLIDQFGTLYVDTVSSTGQVTQHEFVFCDVDADLVTLL